MGFVDDEHWEHFARDELIPFGEVNISLFLLGCIMIDYLHFISFLRNPLTPFTRSNFQATSPAVLRGQEGEGNQESSNNAGTAVVQASSSFDYCAIMWKMLEGREHISTHFGGYFVGMWLDQVFNSCNILVNIFVLMVSSIWNSFHLCCIQKLRERHH